MKLIITPAAQQWFTEEVRVSSESGIRFYGKIYGKTDVHEGFSIGMSVESPTNPLIIEVLAGIPYFIEETDDWFFKGYDLTVDYDVATAEPKYIFEKNHEDLVE